MMIYNRIALLLISVALTLTGCQSPALYNQTTDNVATTQERTKEAIAKSDAIGKPVPPLLVDQGLYVDKTPINLSHEPEWLRKPLILRGEQLPFSYYSRTIVGNTGKSILIHYQEGFDDTTTTSMNYSGTVKGALDVLAAKGGYVYTVNGNNIYWQAYITKTFDVAFMPGASDYMMGKASGGGGSSSAGGGTGGAVTGIIDDSASSQYSSIKGSLSVWKDLEETIKPLLSKDGKVVVSQATTTVTIRDKPANVAIVGRYIANFNTTLAKQVLVKVQVLEVSLSSAFNYGIDWSIVEHAFGGSTLGLNANYGTPVSITPLSGGTTPPTFGLTNAGAAAGTSSGVNILINALKQQGRVAVVTEPRVVCLNNQVSAIRIVSQNGYLASVQNTSFGGGSSTGSSSGNSVTSQITPGTLVTGLTLYILPKIIDNKIFLQVNADLSNSLGFSNISSGGATPTTIQVPNVTQKQFNQRSVIGSGDTLILAGFKQVQNQTGAMQLMDSQALGGKSATQSNSETIILITPIILNGLA
jgi:type IVB pilus formation R64 PilN family outer membrane protein